MANEFWLSDRQWAALEPLIPVNRRGVKPRRNREIISGIMHILKVGCRWRDCPEVYGPHTTIYNRFNRWSKDGIWQTMLGALVEPGSTGSQSITAYDSDKFREFLITRGSTPVIKPNPTRKKIPPFDPMGRNVIERAF